MDERLVQLRVGIVALAAIVLTLLWVNLAAKFSSGLHSYAS